ncbi:hypothetical protein L1D46_01150 [Pseudoalteromonas sp. Isolate3]|uniref:hypothetical protein n=1 Tax=Pseudoalteromonas sp. Isolate3 TaxID=2908526 RepID=UPI001EFD0BF6|nr:hypothetical protein [Pseudoalteromonas sp. Isolate3]MCG9707417.1 hypothetical protein [Pseudoalteromonas sp. Isolate3]
MPQSRKHMLKGQNCFKLQPLHNELFIDVKISNDLYDMVINELNSLSFDLTFAQYFSDSILKFNDHFFTQPIEQRKRTSGFSLYIEHELEKRLLMAIELTRLENCDDKSKLKATTIPIPTQTSSALYSLLNRLPRLEILGMDLHSRIGIITRLVLKMRLSGAIQNQGILNIDGKRIVGLDDIDALYKRTFKYLWPYRGNQI